MPLLEIKLDAFDKGVDNSFDKVENKLLLEGSLQLRGFLRGSKARECFLVGTGKVLTLIRRASVISAFKHLCSSGLKFF